MRLTSRQDIKAPVEFVFAVLNDFGAWERAALRRGADVVRTDRQREIGPGLAWMVKFAYRGKPRQLALRLTSLQPPTTMSFAGTGKSLDGLAGIDLLELAAKRTRMSITLDVRPRNIGARLILQSMRFAKARLERRIADRLGQVCAEIENRYRQSV